jgi:hypothetical protein
MKTVLRVWVVGLVLLIAGSPLIGRAQDDSARKLDQFTKPNWEDAMAHLDNLALMLQNDPMALGVVFVYGGQGRRPHEADAYSNCMKDYLVRRRAVDVNRLVFINGGYRQDFSVEFWLARDRAQIPKATPTTKSTAVRFKGKKIAKWRSLCSL